ncbi:MAG: protein kinase domain-containing protein, partial [Terriglobales bacterium]
PNLISLYELVGEAGEPWFFTMELVAGGADFLHFVGRVRSEVKSPAGWDDTPTATTGMLEAPTLVDTGASHTAPATPVSAAAALDAGALLRLRGALAQMAEGVQALHHAGKLHRDLKPANVMVRADGRLLLLDFGLVLEREEASSGAGAKIVPGAVPESYFSSTVAGTIPFMSPEQAAGAALTPASDWYAVGVMLFEALTGRQPFIGTAREVLERKQHNDAPAPADLSAGVPGDLNTLCRALLGRDASQRADGDAVLRCCGKSSAAASHEAHGSGAEAAALFGREEHLAALRQAFAHVQSGKTVVAHLHGASGLGKSSILDGFLRELAARLDPRPLLLRGRCYEQESVPYKAMDSVIDALANHLRLLPSSDLTPLLPDNAGALVRVFPVLERALPLALAAANGAQTADVNELRRQAFAALRILLTRLGRRSPLVLVIDDLQWGDVDSAALLEELVRPPHPPGMLLLVSYRDEYVATSACLRALTALDAMRDAALHTVRIPVAALPPQRAQALARLLLGAAPDAEAKAERIARESGGNPYFIHELTQHATATASTLDAMLWNRVQLLPAPARTLLEM